MVTYISQYQIERRVINMKTAYFCKDKSRSTILVVWFRWRILLVQYLLGHWGGFVNFSGLDWKFHWNVGGKVFRGPRHYLETAPYLPILLLLTGQCWQFLYKLEIVPIIFSSAPAIPWLQMNLKSFEKSFCCKLQKKPV